MLPGLSMPMMRRRFTEGAVLITDGTVIGNMTSGGGLARSFNDDTVEGSNASRFVGPTEGWVGKTWPAPRRFSRAIAWSHASSGFTDDANGTTITLSMRGKNGAAPAGPSEGDLLATLSTPEAIGSKTITGAGFSAAYLHWWLVINGPAAGDKFCSELQLWELL